MILNVKSKIICRIFLRGFEIIPFFLFVDNTWQILVSLRLWQVQWIYWQINHSTVKHWVHTPYFTLQIIQCTLNAAHYTVHTAYCTLYSAQCTLHIIQCTVHTALYTLCSVHFPLPTINWTLKYRNNTLHTAQCTLHTAQHSLFCDILFTPGGRGCPLVL